MRHGVLSVDPGKTSGIAFLTWSGATTDSPVLKYSTESAEDVYASDVVRALSSLSDYDKFIVACEKFTITAKTVTNSQAPYSLEQIGVLKHLCREYGYPVEDIKFQTPADAKNMFPNPTLKKLEIWHKGGEGHANDALRHALLALVKAKWAPVQLLS